MGKSFQSNEQSLKTLTKKTSGNQVVNNKISPSVQTVKGRNSPRKDQKVRPAMKGNKDAWIGDDQANSDEDA